MSYKLSQSQKKISLKNAVFEDRQTKWMTDQSWTDKSRHKNKWECHFSGTCLDKSLILYVHMHFFETLLKLHPPASTKISFYIIKFPLMMLKEEIPKIQFFIKHESSLEIDDFACWLEAPWRQKIIGRNSTILVCCHRYFCYYLIKRMNISIILLTTTKWSIFHLFVE